MEPFFHELRVWLMGSINFSVRRTMNHDRSNADTHSLHASPASREWSNWKRRCFIALLCLLELAMITALVYAVTALWGTLDFG